MECWRQGDVLLIRVDKIPEGLTKAKDLVLAHGEVTGHAHRILSRKGVARWVAERLQYLEITRPKALLKHEEHATVELPAGKYEVLIQVEYSPGALRSVVD